MTKILLISYDNGSHIPFFPQHLFHLAGSLKSAGHEVGVWLQDIHHGNPEALTSILDANPFDVVGFGFVAGYWQYQKCKEISQAVNRSKRRPRINYVLGGHGPAADPEFFLRKMETDTVVVGDGERAIRLAAHGKKGVIQGDPCCQDEAPLEIYGQLFPLNVYRLIRWPTSTNTDFCFPILSSRGCKWACSFCYRMREGFHERNVGAIMEEIKFLREHVQINHFQFSDELLMSSEERTGEICDAISRLPFKIKWDCNGRLNFSTPKTLSMMRAAGCEYVNYGIESLCQKLLNGMRKGLTVQQIHEGVRYSLEAGLSPGLNFLWGFPGDTLENLGKAVDFLIQYDPCHELRTIRPVTPYPGTPLFELAKGKGLLGGTEDFYENKHKNSDLFTVNFMDMPTQVAHQHLMNANYRLWTNYIRKRTSSMTDRMEALYAHRDSSFRGFRAV